MESENPTEILVAAKKYLSQGLIPTPCQGKKPILPEWQKQSVPTDTDLQNWFGDGHAYNVGIRCGSPSRLIVLDIDSDSGKKTFDSITWSASLATKIEATRKTLTGNNGIHVWFRYNPADFPDGGIIKGTVLWRQQIQDAVLGEKVGEILLQGDGKQVISPPSVHPDSQKPYLTNDKDIQQLTAAEFEELLSAFGKKQRRSSSTTEDSGDISFTDDRDRQGLDPEQMQDLLETLRPFYKQNSRDFIVFGLSGMLHKEGYSEGSALRFVNMLCNVTNDEEKESRLEVVRQTFRKPPSKVSGWSILNEIG
jgi:hypothetical protein